MPTVEDDQVEAGSTPQVSVFEQKQRQRMLVALAVLLIALILVLIKDRQFWFPSNPSAESETVDQSTPSAANPAVQQKAASQMPPAHPKPKQAPASPGEVSGAQANVPPVAVATNRTVLPPLEIEVVAGDQHRAVQSTTSNPVKVDMQPGSIAEQPPATESSGGTVTSTAVERVTVSPGVAERVSRSIDPNYPLLAKQMKVQGAVVLQALIDKGGKIQDLHVLSGPAILAAAAQQAVRQWHFKPYYQSGRPVETEARITVNFTISTY